MHDDNRQAGAAHPGDAAPVLPDNGPAPAGDDEAEALDDGLLGDIATLIDDGRTYAEAEIAFQKSRAGFVARTLGVATGLAVLAVILLHIAFLALAVGLVIALTPVVTVWGAIAIVVGGMLALVGLLIWMAVGRGKRIGALFAAAEEESGS